MKAIVFVCLLSVSMCLSVPATPSDVKGETQNVPADPKIQNPPKTEEKPNQENNTATAAPIINTLPDNNKTSKDDAKANKTEAKPDSTVNKNEKETTSATTEKPTEKAPSATAESKTTDSKPAPSENKIAPNGTANNTVVPANNTIVPAKKGETTDSSKAVTPTEVPNVPAKPVPVVTARGFDGASFVGGIILTLGLLAIGFMGFKYYKNQTERNYHTL